LEGGGDEWVILSFIHSRIHLFDSFHNVNP
jgi:hypothetical protein